MFVNLCLCTSTGEEISIRCTMNEQTRNDVPVRPHPPRKLKDYKQIIENTYGPHIFQQANKLKKYKKQVAVLRNELRFLERCVKHRLTPTEWLLPSYTWEEQAHHLLWVRQFVVEKYNGIISQVQDTEVSVASVLNVEDARTVLTLTEHACERRFQKSKRKFKRRFHELQLCAEEDNYERWFTSSPYFRITPNASPVSLRLTEPQKDVLMAIVRESELKGVEQETSSETTGVRLKNSAMVVGGLPLVGACSWCTLLKCEVLEWLWSWLQRGEVLSDGDVIGEYERRLCACAVSDERSEEAKKNEWKVLVRKIYQL